jgi:hypothetical protein
MVVQEVIHLLKLVILEVQEEVEVRIVEQKEQEMFPLLVLLKDILVEMQAFLRFLIVEALVAAEVMLLLA